MISPKSLPENSPRRHPDTKAPRFFRCVSLRLPSVHASSLRDFVVVLDIFRAGPEYSKLVPLILVTTFFLASCSPLDASRITATPAQATQTPILTPTIVWFPPSATPAPATVATQPATPEMHPGLGPTILTDRFSSDRLWDTAVDALGSVAIDRNRLTLASQPGVYLISFRSGQTFTDFYAEITAKPSLCRAGDSYGFLVRGSAVAYYRFALACNGMVRADRISVDTRRPLQEPVLSGDVPPGAPGEVRIGVWAAGSELRLFLNGRFQFSITDVNYPSGGLGVFTQSTGDTPVTVTFSELVVRDVDYDLPAETAVP